MMARHIEEIRELADMIVEHSHDPVKVRWFAGRIHDVARAMLAADLADSEPSPKQLAALEEIAAFGQLQDQLQDSIPPSHLWGDFAK